MYSMRNLYAKIGKIKFTNESGTFLDRYNRRLTARLMSHKKSTNYW